MQQVRGVPEDKIAPVAAQRHGLGRHRDTRSTRWARAAWLDQLVGQYLAEVAGLGPLVAPANIRKTLESIYRYNYKRTLLTHQNRSSAPTR